MQVNSQVTSEINMSEAGTDLRDRGPPINALFTGRDRRRHCQLLDGSMSENRVGEARTDLGDRSRSRGVLPSLDAALACACNSHICLFLCALLITMGGSLAVTFSMPSHSKLQGGTPPSALPPSERVSSSPGPPLPLAPPVLPGPPLPSAPPLPLPPKYLIPKTIWMYWHQGRAQLDELQLKKNKHDINAICVRHWETLNPGWQVRVLDAAQAAKLAPEHIRAVGHNSHLDLNEHLALKSDLLRLELLSQYGGVWADVSIMPVWPLDAWLPHALQSADGFFGFPFCDRPSDAQCPRTQSGAHARAYNVMLNDIHNQKDATCHMDYNKGAAYSRLMPSWFLAARQGHPVIEAWRSKLTVLMRGLVNDQFPYYLVHCALAQAAHENASVTSLLRLVQRHVYYMNGNQQPSKVDPHLTMYKRNKNVAFIYSITHEQGYLADPPEKWLPWLLSSPIPSAHDSSHPPSHPPPLHPPSPSPPSHPSSHPPPSHPPSPPPSPPQPRKPAIWIHFHKAAGTWICAQAKRRGEKILKPEATCNYRDWEVDGVQQMGARRQRLSCEERRSVYRSQAATWGQIEREYNEEDLDCGADFLYGAMVREPEHLMASVAAFNQFDLNAVVLWLQSQAHRGEKLGGTAHVACPTDTACYHHGHPQLSFQLFDNFMVRSLNGYSGWWLPPGTVNRNHLEHAKRVLSSFEMLLTIETLDDGYVQLMDHLGWKRDAYSTMPVRPHGSTAHGTLGESLRDPTAYLWLVALNSLDIELYMFAAALATKKSNASRLRLLPPPP